MRRITIVIALAIALLGALAVSARAGVVCSLYAKLGIDNVKDCEVPL